MTSEMKSAEKVNTLADMKLDDKTKRIIYEDTIQSSSDEDKIVSTLSAQTF